MKKKSVSLFAVMAAALLLGGCGSNKGVEEYVTLGDYGNLEVVMDTVGVDPEELSTQMNDIYASFSTKEHGGILNRPVKVGDTVNIDYVGKKDDVAFDGGTAENQSLEIGSGQYIPGFEDGLVGAQPGETVDLNATFPENYGVDELNGQDVVFTVTVNYIYPSGLTAEEMDDAVIASIGIPDVTNGKELEQYVYDWLYSQYEESLQDNIMTVLMDRCTYKEFSKKIKEPYEKKWQEDWDNFCALQGDVFAAYGISVEQYLQMSGYEDAEDFIQQNVERDMKKEAILQAIAVKEGIELDETELQTWLQEQVDQYGFASVDEFTSLNSMDDLKRECLDEKVLRYLMDNTTVKAAE